jgi:flagellar L-ring protein precursor FlgH
MTAPTQQSLIDPATFRGPAADQRAYRVGDVLTVLVVEASSAVSQAGTNTERSTGITAGLTNRKGNYNYGLNLDGKHSGTAQTTRVGQLNAQITVRVTGVENDGLMHVSGSQSMVINGEHQSITLSGLVRTADISATNTIMSNQIADANVSLSGQGVVSEAQRRNIILRVLGWLGLP